MDTLEIKQLEIFAYHGLFQSEKELGQKFVVDMAVDFDMSYAAKDHNLDQSIHYGELCQQLTQWTQETKEDLIETVAQMLIDKTFDMYPVAKKITLTLKKPWAPVHLPLETCAVTLTRQKNRVFIGLGSNMRDKAKQLETALSKMQQNGITILNKSTCIETQPWGNIEQEMFLNQVVEVETILTPTYLMDTLLRIEEEMGRVREIKWGPRVIDLDILLFGNQVIYEETLVVPHPYMAERLFVLESLQEIAPHFIHPVKQLSIRELYEKQKQIEQQSL